MSEENKVPEAVREATQQVVTGMLKMAKALEEETEQIRRRVDELESAMKNG